MNNYKLKIFSELIFTISIIPVMIGAIIKSLTLIGTNTSLSIFKSTFMQTNGGAIIYMLLLINMILALASIQVLFINLFLIRKNNNNLPNFSSWANLMIKLCALSNIIVIWCIDKTKAISNDITLALVLWTTTLIISFLSSIATKIIIKNSTNLKNILKLK